MERQQGADKITGDHEVMRFVKRNAVRIKSIGRWIDWPRLHKIEPGIILHYTPWMGTVRATHKRREKATGTECGELVGDGGVRRIVSAQELRMARPGDVKEEDLILPSQNTEQATEGQRPPIAGDADMVGLVAH